MFLARHHAWLSIWHRMLSYIHAINFVKTNPMNNEVFVQFFETENLNTVASPRGEMVVKRPQPWKACDFVETSGKFSQVQVPND